MRMMFEDLFIPHEGDDAVIFTIDGIIKAISGESKEEIEKNADAIQGAVSLMMKKKECNTGYWLFKIKNKWQKVDAFCLNDDDEDEETDEL